MTQTDALARAPSAPAAAAQKHIVDVLIEERARAISGWLLNSPLTGPLLRQVFRYSEARALADELGHLTGEEAFDRLTERLSLQVSAANMESVPTTGPAIVVLNHPTGLADGLAIWQILRQRRSDIVFFANADALRVAPRFDDIIIPIEWRVGQRSPSKSKVALVRSMSALRDGKCLVVFPSGIPAIPSPIFIDEQPWLPTFVGLAAKTGAPIIPVAMKASNSLLFYVFCVLNKPMRHMSLFREFVNKNNKCFRLTALALRYVHGRPEGLQTLASSIKDEVMAAARTPSKENDA
jgi:putative hemolysin